MPFEIVIQPNTSGMTNLRSPVINVYNGCYTGLTYDIYIYATTGTTGDFEEIGIISRTPNLNGYIFLDYSQPLRGYLKNNIKYSENNVLRYYTNARVFVGGSIVELPSNEAIGNLGYALYAQNGLGQFNQMESIESKSYLMNCQITGKTYYIPIEHYELTIKNQLDYDTVNVYYTDTDGVPGTLTIEVPDTKTNAVDETFTLSCGYKDLIETHLITNLDTTLGYSVFYSGKTNTLNDKTYIFGPEDYCDDELTTLQFLNKQGVWDYFYFIGKKETGTMPEFETYKYNRTFSKDYFMTYDIEFGQYHKFFTGGKDSIVLNTGWCDDIKNRKLDELFYSEYIFDYNTRMPLILKDKDIEYKTEKYDKLVQYTLQFEPAYDKMNSII